jgi:hypothetical protein
MINIAELLKDCPDGMELDCLMFDNLAFYELDSEAQDYPIVARLPNGVRKWFTSDGRYELNEHAKCVIFPKGKTTWEGFVPPCKFKDGDVISDSLGTCIFKGEGRIKGTVDYYCGMGDFDTFRIKDEKSNPDGHYGNISDYMLATEEEKDKLFKVIKDNGYRWNAETKTLYKLIQPKFKVGDRIRSKKDAPITISNVVITKVNECGYKGVIGDTTNFAHISFEYQDIYELVSDKFDITTLKPFESRVLVRSESCKLWKPAIFGCCVEGAHSPYYALGGTCWKYCIPYEGNESLCGKTDDCDEFYKTWQV